jgi:hypothetical protein
MADHLVGAGHPLDLSVSDRLRYFDLLTRADAASNTIEGVAGINISKLEASDFLTPLSAAEADEDRQTVAQDNARLISIYGDCVVPMVYPHLEDTAETAP